MKRWTAVGVGVCALVGLALVAQQVGASEGDEEHADKRIEKKIKIVTRGGGAGGFLGVTLEDVEGAARGAAVRSVGSDSAAEKAGIESGDVIVRFDGEDVRSASQLARLVRETPPGREVEVQVERGGASRTLRATLGKKPHGLQAGPGEWTRPDVEDFDLEMVPEPPEGVHAFRWHGDDDHDLLFDWAAGRPRLGIRFLEIGGQLADYFDLTSDEGVLVASVEPDSPAEKAGIKAGDVVLEFGGTPIHRGTQLRRAVRKAEAGQAVTVKLQRRGQSVEVQVTLPEKAKPKMPRHTSGVSL